MAAKKESALIEYELEFLDRKLEELKQYIEDRPFHKLEDRFRLQKTKAGGVMEVLTSSIEVQRKDITSAIKEYAEISNMVKKMRQQEDSQPKTARGGGDVPYRMKPKEEREEDEDKNDLDEPDS